MSQISNRPVDWESLVTENENRLYRAALAILGHPQEAEDAVQDAFVRYLEKAPEKLEHPSAWLMRVLVNGCKSRLRLSWRRVAPLPEDLPALAELAQNFACVTTTRVTPQRRLPGCWAVSRGRCAPASPEPGRSCGSC